jgi:hypothetical protein
MRREREEKEKKTIPYFCFIIDGDYRFISRMTQQSFDNETTNTRIDRIPEELQRRRGEGGGERR